jgi:hypothetical protein
MGMFDNTTQTSGTQTSTSSPWSKATPLWSKGLTDALSLYKSKKLNPYVGLNSYQQNGLNTQYGNAASLQGALQNAMDITRGTAFGSGDVGSGYQSNIGSRALGPSYAEQNLANVADGSMIGGNDPNYERLRQRAQENAATEAGMVASGLGRSGSDYHQTAVARQVGDTVAGMDMQRLAEQEARQMQANQMMDSARQSGLGLGLNAYNSASSIQGANQDRRYNASQAIPGMSEAYMMPGQIMQGVGNAYQADAMAQKGTPGMNLQSLMNILQGTNQFNTTTGGTTGSAQGPDNTLGMILGGGLGLTSLLTDGGAGGLLGKWLS